MQLSSANLMAVINIIRCGLVYGTCNQQNVYVAALIINYISGSLYNF
jgi:hypothetical protein